MRILIKPMPFIILLVGCQQIPSHIAIPEVDKPINDVEKIINDIHIGMNKKQIIEILGYPLTTEADKNQECLTYPLTTRYSTEFILLFERGILTKYNKS
ncbi:outer membrane protein assembly factor BamE domain-containing protein, partial [Ursidibacter arcticus]